jgi:hypothetical protein
MSCAIIPFDELGCLNINLTSGFAKEIRFTLVEDDVEIPLDIYSDFKFNVYDQNGVTLFSSLSKKLGNGIVKQGNTLILTLGNETKNIQGNFYWNMEYVKPTGNPSDYYYQGFYNIQPKIRTIRKSITKNC